MDCRVNSFEARQINVLGNMSFIMVSKRSSLVFVLYHRNQYNRSMERKKMEIPFRDFINDSQNLSQYRIQEDLLKMKDCIALSSQQIIPISSFHSNKELIISRKKRSRKEASEESIDRNFLNISKLGLRKVLQQQKVKSMAKNFINKMKRNMIQSSPVEYHPYVYDYGRNFLSKDGFEIPNWFDLSFAFFSIIQIFILFFVYTLALVFAQFEDSQFVSTLQTFSMCFYTVQIIINFVSIKSIEGRKIVALNEICTHYIKRKFFIDLLCLVVLIIDINIKFALTSYFRLCVILKMKECLFKMEKIQNVFINNFYKQQYWSLAKVFLVNFGFAHVLAVLLLAMATLSQINWTSKLNLIAGAPWYELYSWAYYWGTTIMLTVGFGDLAATNYKQAICLTAIQTFSCILLAYNINCVGNLISNIRTQGQEKTKNFRIIRKLAESNQIKQELERKVCNFIDESDKMKKEFGFEDEKQFIAHLPSQLKAEFLKQSNIKIFESITFFKSFTQKTLLNLSEKIQMKIAHPEQIIFRSQQIPQLLILKEGKVGYCTKLSGSDFSGTVIDKLKISLKDKPKILYLGFLSENVRNVRFKIKSLHYSIVYFIGVDEAKEIMKNVSTDFENYCQIKDKSKHTLDEFEVVPCQYCPTDHTKMGCPKLHYSPLYQMVVYKYLRNIKVFKNQRSKFCRSKPAIGNPFKLQSYFARLSETLYKNKQSGKAKKEGHKKDEEIRTIPKLELESSLYLQRIARLIEIKREDADGIFEWDIVCDVAHNFKFYFQEHNTSKLSTKIINTRKSVIVANDFPRLTKIIGSADFLV